MGRSNEMKIVVLTDTVDNYSFNGVGYSTRTLKIETLRFAELRKMLLHTCSDGTLGISIEHHLLRMYIHSLLGINGSAPAIRRCTVHPSERRLTQSNYLIAITLPQNAERPTSCYEYQKLFETDRVNFTLYHMAHTEEQTDIDFLSNDQTLKIPA